MGTSSLQTQYGKMYVAKTSFASVVAVVKVVMPFTHGTVFLRSIKQSMWNVMGTRRLR